MKKIIVHNGIFHADDIMAIVIVRSMLDIGNDVPIERTNAVSEEDLNDPEVFVLDVGGQYNTELNNFDHHQDSTLPSACVLVAEKFIPEDLLLGMMKYLLVPISDNDRGLSLNTPATISSVVSRFNGIHNGFHRALAVCEEIFNAYYFSTMKSMNDKINWDRFIKQDNVAIQTNMDKFVPSWRTFAEEEGIEFLICPSDRQEGQWNLISRDSALFPIPADDKQVFLHANKFLAVYSSYADVIKSIL